jgi:hypothetical protein
MRSSYLLTLLLFALTLTKVTAVKLVGKNADNEVVDSKKSSLLEKMLPITSKLFIR